MKKVTFAIAIVALVVCCSYALAAAVKVALVPVELESDASGHAVLNYAKGADKTEVQINCWDLEPGEEYTVYLKPAGWLNIGTFTARKNGSGNLHVSLEGDHSGDLPVAVNLAVYTTVLLSE